MSDELDALTDRLTNIETDLQDARDHYGDAFGEVGEMFDELAKRISKLERPSPMLLDAMNRLHAIDGQGNGDVDPPPTVCEGCIENPPCFCGESWEGPEEHPPCYVEKDTCGTCKHPFRKEGCSMPCFNNPTCAQTNYEKPIWVCEGSTACPNHKPLKVSE
jgi:hypothetical protein